MRALVVVGQPSQSTLLASVQGLGYTCETARDETECIHLCDRGQFNVVLVDLESPGVDAGDSTAVPEDSADVDGDDDTAEKLPLDLGGDRCFPRECSWRLRGYLHR